MTRDERALFGGSMMIAGMLSLIVSILVLPLIPPDNLSVLKKIILYLPLVFSLSGLIWFLVNHTEKTK